MLLCHVVLRMLCCLQRSNWLRRDDSNHWNRRRVLQSWLYASIGR